MIPITIYMYIQADRAAGISAPDNGKRGGRRVIEDDVVMED